MPSILHAQQILVNITDLEQDDKDGKKRCNIKYEITNNSTGTIHNLAIEIEIWDDRGQLVSDDFIGTYFRLYTGKILLGETYSAETYRGMPETTCEYIERVKIKQVEERFCNIRMFPEDASCRDFVKITSSVSQLILD